MNHDDIAEGGQSPAPQGQEVEKIESKQAAASDADEMRERLLRALADAENARKRADRARAEGRESGIADLVSKIVPALDSLDLATETAGRTEEGTQPSVDALIDGLRATSRAFLDALIKVGVERICPGTGEVFDPNIHDAISSRYDAETGDGLVLETLQPGYRVAGRLVRPARVVIARAS